MQEYLFKVRTILNFLASICDLIPTSHHIDVTLEGLLSEFGHVVFVIKAKFGLMDFDEVEILLLTHEVRLNKFKKLSTIGLVSLNLTQAASSHATNLIKRKSV